MSLACVILAAGEGIRMNSSIPKVLHKLYDIPMLEYVLNAGKSLKPERVIIVVGKRHKLIRQSIMREGVSFIEQEKPLGTAHALIRGITGLKDFRGTVVLLNGDMPLITPLTLTKFLRLHRKAKNSLSIASFIAEDPLSYGRIIRDKNGRAVKILEVSDIKDKEGSLKEVNSGLYAIESSILPLLKKIKINRKKGEYYLTDLLELTVKNKERVAVYCMADKDEFMGINTRADLSKAHDILRKREVLLCLKNGVNFIDMDSVFIDPLSAIGGETLIYPNVHIQGRTKIGRGCIIYPNVRIIDSIIEDGAVIKDSVVVESSVIGKDAQVGPFAHIRPESRIDGLVKIGNFVEVKKSSLGKGTKAMHLTYLGDAVVGRNVNIGAGTITCNYDGIKKHQTIIEDNVFIGSDSQFIAPVKVKKGSYIGAGSTITRDVPKGSLAISRAKQKNIIGWVKKRLKPSRNHWD